VAKAVALDPSPRQRSWGGNPIYSVSDVYNNAVHQATASYSTPNGNTTWGYFDYIMVGNPTSPSRVFQTPCKLGSGGSRTLEEFH